MNKFWKWMTDRGYGLNSCSSINIHIYNTEYNTIIQPTKHMLIGYMIEYLSENGIFRGLASNKGFQSIESYYNDLENLINDL